MNNVGYVLDVEDNYEALVVRDEQGEDWIEFQRALTYDDQDRELGMDTYCLVRGGSAAYYGGLISWKLRYGILQLQLDADASATVPALLDALEKVLRLHPRVVVLTADPEFGRMEDDAICGACIVNHEPADWPCPTVRAITAALNGGDQ